MKTIDGKLVVISGASRCGKTTLTAALLRSSRRAFAWDPDDQWAQLPGWLRVTRRAELLRAAQHAPGMRRIAYVPGGDLKTEFNFWAGCVFYSGRYVGPLDCVAEELADVSTPTKAPGNWGILLRRGLKRGINIYAISQRWAEADKTAPGNASRFLLFRVSTATDAKYLATKTRVPQEEIDALQPYEFVDYDATTGQLTRSRIAFQGATPKVKPRSKPI